MELLILGTINSDSIDFARAGILYGMYLRWPLSSEFGDYILAGFGGCLLRPLLFAVILGT